MIKSKNISLRALQKNDSKKILEWANDSELKNLIGGIFPVSEIEHEKWFESKVLESINKIFAIECNEIKEIIGTIGLKNVDLINSNAELYVYIGNKEYRGIGYGTEAVFSLVKFCINELNLHRIYLYVFEYNKRAISSYEKVGFKIEGILRDSLFKNGEYHNKIIMGILVNEFNVNDR